MYKMRLKDQREGRTWRCQKGELPYCHNFNLNVHQRHQRACKKDSEKRRRKRLNGGYRARSWNKFNNWWKTASKNRARVSLNFNKGLRNCHQRSYCNFSVTIQATYHHRVRGKIGKSNVAPKRRTGAHCMRIWWRIGKN